MNSQNRRRIFVLGAAAFALVLSGCNTVGSSASDLGLAGAGGVAGYHLAGDKVGGAAAGAAIGYIGSRVAQSEIQRTLSEAEKRGYERAMNQAVKQQYWLMQARQREEKTTEHDARLVAVVVPETNINGVIQAAHVEYLRVAQ